MKSSARNQFAGTVSHISHGVVTDEIQIRTEQNVELVATITHGSAIALGLRAGSSVIAMIKAPSVILVTDTEGVRFSARNQLTGTITQVRTGSVNSEVTLESRGLQVVAVVTNDSAENLGLAVGKTTTALFKASQVILAVRD
ncbi:transporter [Comamonas testosteroni]|uniref:Transporter n=1 Tax=Comamonas testosteroni TaxID=285 RepID=A0A373FSH8_COMTE|nr:TOBE domain-containing protein [Comamonas testosteroni]RGE47114.1 transporter [Comamonas testosteroni]